MSTSKLVWGSGEEFGHKVMVSTADSVGKYDYGVAPLPINPMIIDEVKKAEAEQGKESKTLAAYAMVPANPPTHRFDLHWQAGWMHLLRWCRGDRLAGLFSAAAQSMVASLLIVECSRVQGKEPEAEKKPEAATEEYGDDEMMGSQVSCNTNHHFSPNIPSRTHDPPACTRGIFPQCTGQSMQRGTILDVRCWYPLGGKQAGTSPGRGAGRQQGAVWLVRRVAMVAGGGCGGPGAGR